MDVVKSSLVGLLLENGEDDLAAVLAVSELPDVLDIDLHRETLGAMGIPIDELVAPAEYAHVTIETERVRHMETTISRRWADLVEMWTGR